MTRYSTRTRVCAINLFLKVTRLRSLSHLPPAGNSDAVVHSPNLPSESPATTSSPNDPADSTQREVTPASSVSLPSPPTAGTLLSLRTDPPDPAALPVSSRPVPGSSFDDNGSRGRGIDIAAIDPSAYPTTTLVSATTCADADGCRSAASAARADAFPVAVLLKPRAGAVRGGHGAKHVASPGSEPALPGVWDDVSWRREMS